MPQRTTANEHWLKEKNVSLLNNRPCLATRSKDALEPSTGSYSQQYLWPRQARGQHDTGAQHLEVYKHIGLACSNLIEMLCVSNWRACEACAFQFHGQVLTALRIDLVYRLTKFLTHSTM